MEILFATNLPAWGGGENWMLTAARAMGDRGHGVTLAAPAHSEILGRAQKENLPTLAVPFTRDFDPVSFFRVFRHCRQRGVDVLCLNMDRVLRVAGLAARLAGVPVVIPRRGSEFPLKGHLNYRFHYKWVATALLVNSQATARTLYRDISWRPRGRLYVLYNGIDLSAFEPPPDREAARAELGWGAGDVVLVAVGELTTRKNAALLVSALPRLLEQQPHARVAIVGQGPEEGVLRELARAGGAEDRVDFLGFRRDVPRILTASDVLVHCARVEGFGYVVAEAGAAGLPVVAADASSVPEIVEPEVTGRLFPADDQTALIQALGPYLADPAQRAEHGRAGQAHVRRRFGLEEKMKELEAIFLTELDS